MSKLHMIGRYLATLQHMMHFRFVHLWMRYFCIMCKHNAQFKHNCTYYEKANAQNVSPWYSTGTKYDAYDLAC